MAVMQSRIGVRRLDDPYRDNPPGLRPSGVTSEQRDLELAPERIGGLAGDRVVLRMVQQCAFELDPIARRKTERNKGIWPWLPRSDDRGPADIGVILRSSRIAFAALGNWLHPGWMSSRRSVTVQRKGSANLDLVMLAVTVSVNDGGPLRPRAGRLPLRSTERLSATTLSSANRRTVSFITRQFHSCGLHVVAVRTNQWRAAAESCPASTRQN